LENYWFTLVGLQDELTVSRVAFWSKSRGLDGDDTEMSMRRQDKSTCSIDARLPDQARPEFDQKRSQKFLEGGFSNFLYEKF